MVKIKSIPEYVVHGDDDRTVNVSQSRTHGGSRQEGRREYRLCGVPGGSHVSVAEPNFAPMLDFFARQQKKPEHP